MGSMRKSRLIRYKQGRLVEHFVAGTTAQTAASLCGLNRKTAALYFLRLREIIADELEAESGGQVSHKGKSGTDWGSIGSKEMGGGVLLSTPCISYGPIHGQSLCGFNLVG